jgi:hypothetical protein
MPVSIGSGKQANGSIPEPENQPFEPSTPGAHQFTAHIERLYRENQIRGYASPFIVCMQNATLNIKA